MPRNTCKDCGSFEELQGVIERSDILPEGVTEGICNAATVTLCSDGEWSDQKEVLSYWSACELFEPN